MNLNGKQTVPCDNGSEEVSDGYQNGTCGIAGFY